MQEEIWKDIKGYEGSYQVSNLGRVKSISRVIKTKNNYRHITGRILKFNKNKWGYTLVYIISKNYAVHRLVASAFIPNPNNLPQVNHIDGDKDNNCVNNLEWCTASFNLKEAYRLGLKKPTRPNLGKSGKLNAISKTVYQFDKNGNFVKSYDSVREAYRQTKIYYKCISDCCLGNQKTAGGYIWKYAK